MQGGKGAGLGRGMGWGCAGARVGDSVPFAQIIERCSAEVGRMKQTEELIRLTQRLRFHKVKVSPCLRTPPTSGCATG